MGVDESIEAADNIGTDVLHRTGAVEQDSDRVVLLHRDTSNDEEADPNELVGLVKSKEWLEENGGEQFESSVIFRDTAYDVIDGFIGEPLLP